MLHSGLPPTSGGKGVETVPSFLSGPQGQGTLPSPERPSAIGSAPVHERTPKQRDDGYDMKAAEDALLDATLIESAVCSDLGRGGLPIQVLIEASPLPSAARKWIATHIGETIAFVPPVEEEDTHPVEILDATGRTRRPDHAPLAILDALMACGQASEGRIHIQLEESRIFVQRELFRQGEKAQIWMDIDHGSCSLPVSESLTGRRASSSSITGLPGHDRERGSKGDARLIPEFFDAPWEEFRASMTDREHPPPVAEGKEDACLYLSRRTPLGMADALLLRWEWRPERRFVPPMLLDAARCACALRTRGYAPPFLSIVSPFPRASRISVWIEGEGEIQRMAIGGRVTRHRIVRLKEMGRLRPPPELLSDA